MKTTFSLALVTIFLAGAASAQEASSKAESAAMQAKWEKILPRLQKADDESIAAINETLADVGGSFDTAARNARPFVDDLLGWYGKWRYAKAIPGKVSGYGTSVINYVFGSRYESPLATDDFEAHARETFVDRVFDPEVFKRGVQGGVDSYVARLEAIEARLLVELQADVEVLDVRAPSIHVPKLDEELLNQVDVAVRLSVDEAASDFGFTVAKELFSQWGGSVASGILLTSTAAGAKAADPTNDPFSAMAFAGGAAIGFGVSYVVDKTVEAAGYDPSGKLAARIEGVLRGSQKAVFEGSDVEKSSRYVWFALLRNACRGTPDGVTCGRAADRLEATTFLGLRPTLTALHGERLCLRRRLVCESIFGSGATMPVGCFLSAGQASQVADVVAKAEESLEDR